ncbi:T9SS type A sorting domain-containing protein [bacterium]|nr:T9SS type A sorting domain-containing protein [bacterium]
MKKIILLAGMLSGLCFSQTKTMDRRFVPIIISGSQFPRADLRISEWAAFRFDAQRQRWTAVPFQVDEVDIVNGQRKYNHVQARNDLIDPVDEMLVMPEDLGDRAAIDQWLDGHRSRREFRIELTFFDPMEPDKKAWLYLYHTATAPAVSGYHRYSPAPAGTAADTAQARSFRIGRTHDGWIDYISLAAAPEKNLVDRLKLRLSGKSFLPGLGRYTCNEDTLNNGGSTYHSGCVRALHDQRPSVSFPVVGALKADHQWEYYPYSFRIGASGIAVQERILQLIGLNSIRQSLDLSLHAVGGCFYSEVNSGGVPIDGNPETIEGKLKHSDGAQWLMASGSWGTIEMIVECPKIRNATVSLYYYDSQAGGTLDGSLDTGDKRSIGDMGLWVHTKKNNLSTDRLSIDFTCYLIDEPNHNAAFGRRLFQWDQNDVMLEYQEQSDSADLADANRSASDGWVLQPGAPNPFHPQHSTWRTVLHTPAEELGVEARLYNLLGQCVAVLTPHAADKGSKLFSWEGLGSSGVEAPEGVYVLRIQGPEQTFSQRFLLSR